MLCSYGYHKLSYQVSLKKWTSTWSSKIKLCSNWSIQHKKTQRCNDTSLLYRHKLGENFIKKDVSPLDMNTEFHSNSTNKVLVLLFYFRVHRTASTIWVVQWFHFLNLVAKCHWNIRKYFIYIWQKQLHKVGHYGLLYIIQGSREVNNTMHLAVRQSLRGTMISPECLRRNGPCNSIIPNKIKVSYCGWSSPYALKSHWLSSCTLKSQI